jgi:hypothetical protein
MRRRPDPRPRLDPFPFTRFVIALGAPTLLAWVYSAANGELFRIIPWLGPAYRVQVLALVAIGIFGALYCAAVLASRRDPWLLLVGMVLGVIMSLLNTGFVIAFVFR